MLFDQAMSAKNQANVFLVLTEECKKIWPRPCSKSCSLIPIIHYSDMMEYFEVKVYHFGHTILKGMNSKWREVREFGELVQPCNCLDESKVFELWQLVAQRYKVGDQSSNYPQEDDVLYHASSKSSSKVQAAIESEGMQRLCWTYKSGRWEHCPELFVSTPYKEYKCCDSGKHLGMVLYAPPFHMRFPTYPIDFYDQLPVEEGMRNIKRLDFRMELLDNLTFTKSDDGENWINLQTSFEGLPIEIKSYRCCKACSSKNIQEELQQEVAKFKLKLANHSESLSTIKRSSWKEHIDHLLENDEHPWATPCGQKSSSYWYHTCDMYKVETLPKSLISLVQKAKIPVTVVEEVDSDNEEDSDNDENHKTNRKQKFISKIVPPKIEKEKIHIIGKRTIPLIVVYVYELLSNPNVFWCAERENVIYYHMYEKIRDGPITHLRLGRPLNTFQHF